MNNCTICDGNSPATMGNENIVDGIVMCDYCTAALSRLVDENPGKYREQLGNNFSRIVGISPLLSELKRRVQQNYA